MMRLGAQLYTVRSFTQTPENLAETLAKVADIGYTSVQVSATCAFDPDWLAEQLQKNGLVCPVTHTNPDRIADDSAAVVAEHKRFACDHIGIGAAPGLWDAVFNYASFRDRFVPVAKRIKELGATLAYHNHEIEFQKIGGVTIMEQMAADFPADTLTFILDTYWVQYAGGDSAAWIEKFSGRVPCLHLKDLAIVGNKQREAVIGEGNINFDTILSACERAGSEYLFIEQDECYGEDPFDCLKRSYQYLNARGLR